MRIEDLSQWIEDDDARYAIVQENNSRETFVKIPYDEDFDFIYHQRGHHGNSLSRNQAFYYCGLYNKLDDAKTEKMTQASTMIAPSRQTAA